MRRIEEDAAFARFRYGKLKKVHRTRFECEIGSQTLHAGHHRAAEFLPLRTGMPPHDLETARWFAEHVQQHEALLRGYLRGLAAPADVDDIVQETYARVLRAHGRGPIESPRGLLFATARNVTRDLFRRRAVSRTVSTSQFDVSQVIDHSPGVADTATRNNEADLLRSAIGALPDRCREILLLRKFENLSHREIAQKLGIAEHTVEAQLTKALRRCEEFFARKGALPRA